MSIIHKSHRDFFIVRDAYRKINYLSLENVLLSNRIYLYFPFSSPSGTPNIKYEVSWPHVQQHSHSQPQVSLPWGLAVPAAALDTHRRSLAFLLIPSTAALPKFNTAGILSSQLRSPVPVSTHCSTTTCHRFFSFFPPGSKWHECAKVLLAIVGLTFFVILTLQLLASFMH